MCCMFVGYAFSFFFFYTFPTYFYLAWKDLILPAYCFDEYFHVYNFNCGSRCRYTISFYCCCYSFSILKGFFIHASYPSFKGFQWKEKICMKSRRKYLLKTHAIILYKALCKSYKQPSINIFCSLFTIYTYDDNTCFALVWLKD